MNRKPSRGILGYFALIGTLLLMGSNAVGATQRFVELGALVVVCLLICLLLFFARRIELVLEGKGQYKDAKFVRLVDNTCHLEAYPAYQLVKGEPEKVELKGDIETFTIELKAKEAMSKAFTK